MSARKRTISLFICVALSLTFLGLANAQKAEASPPTWATAFLKFVKNHGDTTPPQVAITSPSGNTTFSSAQTVNITATASDDVGVTKVEFYDGSTLKGTDTTAPYTYSWTVSSSNNGTHNFTAKAYDAAGNSATSSPVSLVVNIAAPVTLPPSDTTAPTVSISSPAANTAFTKAQTVTITASASDNVGVSKVEFYDGSTLKGTDTSAPFTYSWAISSSVDGTHSFTAKAYDAAGNSSTSSPDSLSVNIASTSTSTPGAFQFDSASYSVNEGAGKVNLTINRVGGSGGTVTVDWGTQQNTATVNVDYQGVSWTPVTFADGETSKVVSVNIIQDTLVEGNETFNVLLSNPTGGATLGSPTTSVVTIVDDDKATADTTAPTVSISSPADGSVYSSAQTVNIQATAQDNVGVSKVEFYDGSKLLATDTSSPYNFAWPITAADNGAHVFTCRAYDAAGNKGTSAAVTYTVNIASTNTTNPPTGPLPIFPGAVGFGTDTIGGRGGVVIRVNTLADNSNPLVNNPDGTKSGSLRSAVAYNGPRIVVFEVSGYITLNSVLRISNPYITIAGQTAPSPGIALRGDCVRIGSGAHDVFIQHVAFRPGPSNDNYGDAISVYGSNSANSPYVYNVVIDHCSLTWGSDENSDFWYDWVSDITYSNTLFGQGLLSHSMGLLLGPGFNNVTLYRDVFSDNKERGPRIENGISHDAYLVMVNNLSYDLKYEQTYVSTYSDSSVTATKPVHISSLNNVMYDGADSNSGIFMYHWDATPGNTIYTSGDEHYLYGSSTPTGRVAQSRSSVTVKSSPDFNLSAYNAIPANQLKGSLLPNVGARPADRDPADQAIIDDVLNGNSDFVSTPNYTTLQQNFSSFPLPANPNSDDNGDGYTNVEEVLHQMAAKVEGR